MYYHARASLRFWRLNLRSKSKPGGVKPRVVEPRVGLQYRTFCPLIPGVDKHHAAVNRLAVQSLLDRHT